MPHSLNTIWVHATWTTKYRLPLIDTNIEAILYEFISGQFIKQECRILIINGMPDHVHALFLLHGSKSIAEVIKQVKGSSSHFINSEKMTDSKFAWQNGYAAFSVSKLMLRRVYHYIENQKKHHS